MDFKIIIHVFCGHNLWVKLAKIICFCRPINFNIWLFIVIDIGENNIFFLRIFPDESWRQTPPKLPSEQSASVGIKKMAIAGHNCGRGNSLAMPDPI
ncbi:MAG: hypothetical protein ACP5D7_10710 [Limnospira sp.]